MNILRVLIALASGLSLSQTIFAATIPVNEDVMTSVFFSGANTVRGYATESNRPVMRVSNDDTNGTTGAETIYLTFNAADFSAYSGPVSAILTMRSVDGGFGANAGAGNPFTVSAHGVNADPLASITDDTNPGGPINWLTFYNNILAANSAASTAVNCIDCDVTFDVSALVNSWIAGTNTIHAIALTGKNDTSGKDFLHGFVNNNNGGTAMHYTFLTVTAVPEPDIYVMLLAGFGLLLLRHGNRNRAFPVS